MGPCTFGSPLAVVGSWLTSYGDRSLAKVGSISTATLDPPGGGDCPFAPLRELACSCWAHALELFNAHIPAHANRMVRRSIPLRGKQKSTVVELQDVCEARPCRQRTGWVADAPHWRHVKRLTCQMSLSSREALWCTFRRGKVTVASRQRTSVSGGDLHYFSHLNIAVLQIFYKKLFLGSLCTCR